MKNLHLKLLSLTLSAISLGLFFYKTQIMGFPILPTETADSWTVEAKVSLKPNGGPIKASLFIPADIPGYTRLDEHFGSYGYGLTTQTVDANRLAVWTVRRARGTQTLYYRVVLHPDQHEPSPAPKPAFPRVPKYPPPYDSAAQTVIKDTRAKSADIATFVAVLLKDLNDPTPSENIALLRDRDPSEEGRVKTAIELLAGARIPARLAHGFHLRDGLTDATPKHWLEVHNGQRWLIFNPTTGADHLPENFVVWWRGTEPVLQLEGATKGQVRFSVARNVHDATDLAAKHALAVDSAVASLSLFALPVQTQNVYRVLLLVPIGAFMIVVLRNIVGIVTFGTFMPVLVALAFRETQLAWGLVLFITIVALGLSIRFYLEHLKLLLVPRLASVLIVVVLLMAALSAVTHKLGLERGLSVALFPMVILSMVIERMSIAWEERGARSALQQGLGTLLVAVLSYGVMSNPVVEHMVFVFPELLLLLLGFTLLMGRYTGYRFTELKRFRSLAGRDK